MVILAERIRKKEIFITFSVFIVIFLFSPWLEARRIKVLDVGYKPEEVTLSVLTEPKVWDSEYASIERYRGMSITRKIVFMLKEIKEKEILTFEDLGLVVACLKYEADFMRFGGSAKKFLEKVVLPGKLSPEDKVFSLILDHLLWAYKDYIPHTQDRFTPSPVIIGFDLHKQEGSAVFLGTLLGLVVDSLNSERGMFGRYKGENFVANAFNNVSGQFAIGAYWSRPENRVDGDHETDEEKPTLELDQLNRCMSALTQRMPDKYVPVVLAFDISKIKLPSYVDLRRLQNYPEIRVGELSLNDLTLECKRILVQALGIKEVKSWMDDEWRRIIQGDD